MINRVEVLAIVVGLGGGLYQQEIRTSVSSVAAYVSAKMSMPAIGVGVWPSKDVEAPSYMGPCVDIINSPVRRVLRGEPAGAAWEPRKIRPFSMKYTPRAPEIQSVPPTGGPRRGERSEKSSALA